ncbi:MAG: NADH-quinone oxidoreductase subunit A [Candidatus Omnitrophica bacterium]|nr:NADH-quinone oxidoreductase subunit A [Candidatus Omnitrophota bacterium]
MLDQLLPVMILFVVTIVFAGGLIFLSSLVGQRGRFSKVKIMPYECGIPGESPASTKIPIKYYLTAISFILFDIEVVFLYPWTLVFVENLKELGAPLLVSMGFFLIVLVYGLFYEWRAGGLEWD